MDDPQFGKANTEEFQKHQDDNNINVKKVAKASAGADVTNLPMRYLIGGPIQAAIDAIEEVTAGTIAFVRTQCFDNGKDSDFKGGKYDYTDAKSTEDDKGNTFKKGGEWGKPRYLNFEYTKTSALGVTTPSLFRVPLMVMVPIPTLRLEFVSVEFLCKVVSIESYNAGINKVNSLKKEMYSQNNAEAESGSSSDSDIDEIDTSLGPVNVMRVNQQKTSSGSTVTKDFSYNVKVRAVDDEKPPGIEKLMEILDSLIAETSGDDATFDSLLNPAKIPDITDFGFDTGGV